MARPGHRITRLLGMLAALVLALVLCQPAGAAVYKLPKKSPRLATQPAEFSPAPRRAP